VHEISSLAPESLGPATPETGEHVASVAFFKNEFPAEVPLHRRAHFIERRLQRLKPQTIGQHRAQPSASGEPLTSTEFLDRIVKGDISALISGVGKAGKTTLLFKLVLELWMRGNCSEEGEAAIPVHAKVRSILPVATQLLTASDKAIRAQLRRLAEVLLGQPNLHGELGNVVWRQGGMIVLILDGLEDVVMGSGGHRLAEVDPVRVGQSLLKLSHELKGMFQSRNAGLSVILSVPDEPRNPEMSALIETLTSVGGQFEAFDAYELLPLRPDADSIPYLRAMLGERADTIVGRRHAIDGLLESPFYLARLASLPSPQLDDLVSGVPRITFGRLLAAAYGERTAREVSRLSKQGFASRLVGKNENRAAFLQFVAQKLAVEATQQNTLVLDDTAAFAALDEINVVQAMKVRGVAPRNVRERGQAYERDERQGLYRSLLEDVGALGWIDFTTQST
jgi:hypothetical protein